MKALQTPMDAIIFDCDSTLSTLEGIDELAKQNGVGMEVEALTHQAMSHTGLNTELYEKRLALVKPTQKQVIALGHDYFSHLTQDALYVIQALRKLKKSIFIISAGLYPSLIVLGNLLEIPKENIFGVDIYFDENGHYKNFDSQSSLTTQFGKRIIVNEIKQKYPRLAYIGDGLNDLCVYDCVTRFVGYGGYVYRKNIAEKCDFYITEATLMPFLSLVLTAAEYQTLT